MLRKIGILLLVLLLSGCTNKPKPQEPAENVEIRGEKAITISWLEGLDIPEYAGKPYVVINDNLPLFDLQSLTPQP